MWILTRSKLKRHKSTSLQTEFLNFFTILPRFKVTEKTICQVFTFFSGLRRIYFRIFELHELGRFARAHSLWVINRTHTSNRSSYEESLYLHMSLHTWCNSRRVCRLSLNNSSAVALFSARTTTSWSCCRPTDGRSHRRNYS